MFTKTRLDAFYFSTKGFYVLRIPVAVPYKKLYSLAEQAGVKQKQAFGPILEDAAMFGNGWIGIEIEKPTTPREDVVHVQGDFEVYEHVGPFKNLGKACALIRKERPRVKEMLNLYMDDPEKVKPENLRTRIHFR